MLTFEKMLVEAQALPINELQRHAMVSRDNRHECRSCFCCACLKVWRKWLKEQRKLARPTDSVTHKPDWEKERERWQARYDLSRKHPELYPEELDAIMADWEPEATPKQWADGEKADRPQRPPANDGPDCPF